MGFEIFVLIMLLGAILVLACILLGIIFEPFVTESIDVHDDICKDAENEK